MKASPSTKQFKSPVVRKTNCAEYRESKKLIRKSRSWPPWIIRAEVCPGIPRARSMTSYPDTLRQAYGCTQQSVDRTTTTTATDSTGHFACAVIHKFPHCPSHRASWNCVQAFIANCCFLRERSTSDGDRLLGDGLAASPPGGLCHKLRREDSHKARLDGKGLQ